MGPYLMGCDTHKGVLWTIKKLHFQHIHDDLKDTDDSLI